MCEIDDDGELLGLADMSARLAEMPRAVDIERIRELKARIAAATEILLSSGGHLASEALAALRGER